MTGLGVRQEAQLKCIYTSTCSMGYKQEELEAIVRQADYDLVAIVEMWWGCSHDWSAAMDGYKLFRRNKKGRGSDGVAVCERALMLLNLGLGMMRSNLYG